MKTKNKADTHYILIKKVYSWYDVYVDNTLILHHIDDDTKNHIIEVSKISGDKIKIR